MSVATSMPPVGPFRDWREACGRCFAKCMLSLAVVAALAMTGVVSYPSIARILFRLDPETITATPLHNMSRFLVFALMASPVVFCCVFGYHRVGQWLHRNRFWIGAALIVAAVALDLNGSSLGAWRLWFGQNQLPSETIFGVPRATRTDEYAVGTPLAFAQSYVGYPYFNHNLGNRATDMFLIKDAPVWTPAEVFRPFHWGYLLLGSSRGLAFYWSARLVALFLASYQFMLMITRKTGVADRRRGLSAIGACLIAFSPMVQWWYAVNALPEMLIAVFTSIVLFDRYLKDRNSWHRLGCLTVILLCAGMFILTLYPAWQIPLGYLLLALIIWVIGRNRHIIRFSWVDVLAIVLALAVFAALMGSVLVQSRDTIASVLNTAYPGQRVSTGGKFDYRVFFAGTAGLLFPLRVFPLGGLDMFANPSEAALFVDLFPLGIVLAIVNLFVERKRDWLSVLLMAVVAFFSLFVLVGFPEQLSRLLFLTSVTSKRAYMIIGLSNVLLLVRALSQRSWHLRLPVVLIIAIAYAGASMMIVRPAFPPLFTPATCAVVGVISAFIMTTLLVRAGRLRSVLVPLAVFGLVASGSLVNPVQYSAGTMTSQPSVQQVVSAQKRKPGLWVVDGVNSEMVANLLAANGVRTLNTVSVTPALKRWKEIDPTGAYGELYNRYAFVRMHVVGKHEKNVPVFQLRATDSLQVNITPSELVRLGVDYVMSLQALETVRDSAWHFEPFGKKLQGYTLYRLTENKVEEK